MTPCHWVLGSDISRQLNGLNFKFHNIQEDILGYLLQEDILLGYSTLEHGGITISRNVSNCQNVISQKNGILSHTTA